MLQENIVKTFKGGGNKLLSRTPVAWLIRARTDIKLKFFCTSKEKNTGMKRQCTEWEKKNLSIHYTRD
jgi:hypothetical protein